MFHESSYVSDLRQRLYSKNMEIHCNTQTIDNLIYDLAQSLKKFKSYFESQQ